MSRKKGETNMYYKVCPDCGAWLDVGEKCDCNGNGSPELMKSKKTDTIIPRMFPKKRRCETSVKRYSNMKRF